MRQGRTLAPAALLLWVGLFLAAQATSVAHQHIDEGADAACVVCTLVKSHTAVTDSHVPAPPPAPGHTASRTADTLARAHALITAFEARAPPLA